MSAKCRRDYGTVSLSKNQNCIGGSHGKVKTLHIATTVVWVSDRESTKWLIMINSEKAAVHEDINRLTALFISVYRYIYSTFSKKYTRGCMCFLVNVWCPVYVCVCVFDLGKPVWQSWEAEDHLSCCSTHCSGRSCHYIHEPHVDCRPTGETHLVSLSDLFPPNIFLSCAIFLPWIWMGQSL